VAIIDKIMDVSQLLGARAQAAPPFYVYAPPSLLTSVPTFSRRFSY